MLSFFPRDVLDEIWDLIESVSEGFPTYFFISIRQSSGQRHNFFLSRFASNLMLLGMLLVAKFATENSSKLHLNK